MKITLSKCANLEESPSKLRPSRLENDHHARFEHLANNAFLVA